MGMRNALLVSALVALSTGCRVHIHDHRPGPDRVIIYDDDRCPDPVGKIVIIERGHVHGADCGHYWHNGQWYHHAGHVHAVGCGHHHHEGVWVLAGAVKIQAGHVHSAHCGHYHHAGQWYFVRGHAHGPGCGHHWDGRIWIAVKF